MKDVIDVFNWTSPELKPGGSSYMPRPLSRTLPPAKRSMTITIYLNATGLVLARILTPTIDPSIIPIIEGTTTIGMAAPLLI
jgi:hypothetical protein